MKRLYKSKYNKVFCGVIGGVGEYFDVDPVILRLLWLLILIATGFIPGLIAYFVACLVVPKNPENIIKQ